MAIDEMLNDHEQSERVREWFRSNTLSLIGGVAVAVGLISGFQWWQAKRHQDQQQAHIQYNEVRAVIDSGDLEKAAKSVSGLTQVPNVFNDLASLHLAAAQVKAGKLDLAISTLKNMRPVPEMQLLVNQRLARLLIETDKVDDAIALLSSYKDGTSLEITGDALFIQNKKEAAHKTYTEALAALEKDAPQRQLLEIKLSQVGENVADAPQKPEVTEKLLETQPNQTDAKEPSKAEKVG